jgi:hypothetical protein
MVLPSLEAHVMCMGDLILIIALFEFLMAKKRGVCVYISNKEVIPYPTFKRRGVKKGLQYWYIIIRDYFLIKSWKTLVSPRGWTLHITYKLM